MALQQRMLRLAKVTARGMKTVVKTPAAIVRTRLLGVFDSTLLWMATVLALETLIMAFAHHPMLTTQQPPLLIALTLLWTAIVLALLICVYPPPHHPMLTLPPPLPLVAVTLLLVEDVLQLLSCMPASFVSQEKLDANRFPELST